MATQAASNQPESQTKERLAWDERAERRVLWKVDLLLMPVLTFSYGLQFVRSNSLLRTYTLKLIVLTAVRQVCIQLSSCLWHARRSRLGDTYSRHEAGFYAEIFYSVCSPDS